MRELLSTFFATTKDRIKNPFIGTLIFSFIVFNWKPILVLVFANESIQRKIEIVESDYTGLFHNLWLPIIFSLFYVLGLPYIMWFFDKISSKAVIGRKENIVEQKLFDFKSEQKFAEEESKLEDIKANYRETADLNKKIEVLSEQVEERDETIQTLQNELNAKKDHQIRLEEALQNRNKNSLTENEKEDLIQQYKSFKHSDLFEFFGDLGSEISHNNSIPNSLENLVVEKFRLSDIIKKVRDKENEAVYYEFTKKGEFFWEKYVLNVQVEKEDDEEDDDLPF